MPAIIASLVRTLIQASVTTAIFSAVDWVISPLVDTAKKAVQNSFNMTPEEAEDTIANEVIDAFAMIGILGLAIRSKIPTKAAEKLGFTSKGWQKRKVSPKLQGSSGKSAKLATTTKVATSVEAGTIAEVVASSRGIGLNKVRSLLTVIATVIGIPTGFFFAFAQYIDFANWQGPYQKTFQRLLAKIGIHPDSPMPKARVISTDIWTRIYSTIEELKPTGLYFPFSGASKPYSRLELAELVDEVAAQMAASGMSTSYKNVLAVVLPLIQLSSLPKDVEARERNLLDFNTSPTTSTQKATTTSTPKVFTGIVSQGVVGQGLVFTPRPDDLIESAEELREAAANNLAPYLTALLGKIVYEVKVVSSILTKEGFKQTGTTQRIQTGTYSNGTPKYKTVTNKFATLVVYAMTDKGSRAKLTTIVLGPVDSAKLTVGQNDLRELESSLPSVVTTTDWNEVTNLQTPQSSDPMRVSEGKWQVTDNFSAIKAEMSKPQTREQQVAASATSDGDNLSTDELKKHTFGIINNWLSEGRSLDILKDDVLQRAKNYGFITDGSVLDTAPVVSSEGNVINKSGRSATTLFEWYQAQGQQLPTVQMRAGIYAGLGLGQAGFYVGTAEQNTKLLNALKAK